ncbi:MAG: hypothetical protein RBR59_00615 [Sulfurimonadaceae bacterium]|jgi:hypothetical protein|nr:hypothetical protein [Sulfurimonadaceae bacterium]
MRILTWLIAIIATIIGLIYIVAFTGFGNDLLKPFIEDKIKQETKLHAKLTTFRVGMSSIHIILALDRSNTITVKGDYSLFSQSFDINYNIALAYLEGLKELTQTELKGSFYTDGNVAGDLKQIALRGKSDFASSQTTYSVDLVDLNPTIVMASIKGAKIGQVLEMVGQPEFLKADLNVDIKFTSLDLENLQGNAKIALTNGVINTKTMKELYDVTLPETTFTSTTNVALAGENVDYTTVLRSNLASFDSGGRIIPNTMGMDLTYALNIAELAVLKPITNAPLRGEFALGGTVKGNQKHLVVQGASNIATSDTKFQAILKDFAPASVNATIKNLQLDKLLYMVEQPHYTDGVFSMNMAISNATMGQLKGEITTDIKNGLLDSKFLTKEFEFKSLMPKTTFTATTHTTLDANKAISKIAFNSSLATFDIKKAVFNLDEASLVSDYQVKVADLDKLFFATDRHLKGSIGANGTLKKDKDLELLIYSELAGGKIDAKLFNDDFHADIKAVQTLQVLEMLIYPEIFSSALSATLDYNLAKEAGKFVGKLGDGKFTQNQIFDLIKQYAKTDMYKENFKGDVSADINKEHIKASLDLRSNKSSITTKDTKLNTKTAQIDSTLDVVFDGNPVTATIKGAVDAPKVSIDLQKFMQSKAGEKVQKEVQKLFKKLF